MYMIHILVTYICQKYVVVPKKKKIVNQINMLDYRKLLSSFFHRFMESMNMVQQINLSTNEQI